MSSRGLVACLPLAAGSALISVAVMPSTRPMAGAFIFEWMGSFLAFYGLSYLMGPRPALHLAGAVLVAGSLGDLALLGGLTPAGWAVVNYMVFVHAIAGSMAGHILRGGAPPTYRSSSPSTLNAAASPP